MIGNLDQQRFRIWIRRHRSWSWSEAIIFLSGFTVTFAMLPTHIVVGGDPGRSAVAGQQVRIETPLTWPGPIPLSETAFNGGFDFISVFLLGHFVYLAD